MIINHHFSSSSYVFHQIILSNLEIRKFYIFLSCLAFLREAQKSHSERRLAAKELGVELPEVLEW